MEEFKCKMCGVEYESYVSISLHYRKTHKISSDDVRKIVYNNGETPICKCGCGVEVLWDYKQDKYRDFKPGHWVRLSPSGFYSPLGAKKSGATRKKRLASGELVIYNKGKTIDELFGKDRAEQMRRNISENKERSEKISKSLAGKPKSAEHRERMNKQLAINRRERLTSGKMSKPERIMGEILQSCGTDYIYQHEVSGFFYDFYVKDKNILIEVDGDFWHCKPNTKYESPIMEEQRKNLVNDKKKTAIAYSNGYTLLRFWESDIQKNPLHVVKKLMENLH